MKTSRLPGFYKLSLAERVERVVEWAGLTEHDRQVLLENGLTAEQASKMIENGIGTHALPLGVAANSLLEVHGGYCTGESFLRHLRLRM